LMDIPTVLRRIKRMTSLLIGNLAIGKTLEVLFRME